MPRHDCRLARARARSLDDPCCRQRSRTFRTRAQACLRSLLQRTRSGSRARLGSVPSLSDCQASLRRHHAGRRPGRLRRHDHAGQLCRPIRTAESASLRLRPHRHVVPVQTQFSWRQSHPLVDSIPMPDNQRIDSETNPRTRKTCSIPPWKYCGCKLVARPRPSKSLNERSSEIEASQPTINAFTHVDRERAIAAAAAVDAQAKGGARDGSAGRRAGRRQRRALHQRHADDLLVQHAAQLPASLRRDRRRKTSPGRCGDRRQDEHGRVRDGGEYRERARSASRAIPGTRLEPPAAAVVVRRPVSPPARCRSAWEPTPVVRFDNRPRSAASPDSNRPMAASAGMGWSHSPAAWTKSDRLPGSVEDVALLLQVIAGYEPRDSTSLERDVPDYAAVLQSTDLRGLRIGVLRDALESDGIDAAIRDAVIASIDVFRDCRCRDRRRESAAQRILGADLLRHRAVRSEQQLVSLRRRPLRSSCRAARSRQVEQLGPLVATYCRSRAEGFGAEVKRRIMIGTYALSEGYADQYYNQALKARRLIKGDYDAAFAQCDLLLGPVSPTTAFRAG